MNENKKIVPLYICVIISLLLSGFAAFSMCFDINSASFPLGVLTLLVTTLVGFQIYSAIDIKNIVNDIKSHTNRTQEETMARAYTSIMNQTSYIVEGRQDNDGCYNAISNGLFACKHYHLAGNSKECIKLLGMIANFKKENCILNKKQIQNVCMIIGQLKECGIDVAIMESWLEQYEKEY